VSLLPELSPVPSDLELVHAVRCGETGRFEEIICRYQARLFVMARRYARREDEVEDIVQEILLKAYTRLETWRGDAPFEHWLMRLGTRICYDFLRQHQRSREITSTELSGDEVDWMERQALPDGQADGKADAARTLVARVLDRLSPASRLVITLLELEDKSVKEVAALTGWSVPVIKVRAFRARLEMKRLIERLDREKYL
jgi:RNA polymerase sigma-70 factor (ECF subfamily)